MYKSSYQETIEIILRDTKVALSSREDILFSERKNQHHESKISLHINL